MTTGKEISEVGASFSRSLRIAVGLPPEPTVEERIQWLVDDFMCSSAMEVDELERRLDALLLPPSPSLPSLWKRIRNSFL